MRTGTVTKSFPIRRADLRAYNRLVIDATLAATDMVENLHHNVAQLPGLFAPTVDEPARGITGLVYRGIRAITRTVGKGVDRFLSLLPQESPAAVGNTQRENLIAALNGVVGDYLLASDNPLRIQMRFRREGVPLELSPQALAQALPSASGKILVLVHGLCMCDLQWRRRGHDHGAALAHETGYTPVYLHYNSGLHVSTNGREFAAQLESLVHAWPVEVERLAIVGFSMGGLVARSACEAARQSGFAWLDRLDDLIFLGTPHDGSPLERRGHRLDLLLDASPYTAALSRLGKLRSAGITDLRHANLEDSDWIDQDRHAAESVRRAALPLPSGVRCHAIAGVLAKKAGALRGRLAGDGLVPLYSALGEPRNPLRRLGIPESRQHVVHATGHLGLLDSAEACAQMRSWLAR
jgi:pimeloyl-ACP methyl ester carboxylesterase